MKADARNRELLVTKSEFLKLMRFPAEWELWEMYPDELFEIQISKYQLGHEDGSEHDRNGAFHWWIKQSPSRDQLRRLFRLAHLDPDRHMANDVRERLRSADNYIYELEAGLEDEL